MRYIEIDRHWDWETLILRVIETLTNWETSRVNEIGKILSETGFEGHHTFRLRDIKIFWDCERLGCIEIEWDWETLTLIEMRLRNIRRHWDRETLRDVEIELDWDTLILRDFDGEKHWDWDTLRLRDIERHPIWEALGRLRLRDQI